MPTALDGAAWRRAAAALVYVDDLAAPALDADDAHHLGRVLRVRDGEAVAAADGAGGWRRCRWASGALAPDGPVVVEPAATPSLAVGFVPTKGERPEWVVQKLTEVGVDRIVVLRSARAVVRWEGDRGGRHLAKLAEVARQAGMQSRRVRLPVVEGPLDLEVVVGSPGWLIAVPGGRPLPAVGADPGPVGVLVGPEGGFTPEEEHCGPGRVALGDGVLRAETAAVLAGGLLAALRAGVVGPAG
ncbi:MAG TPA: RsmE family RNA methyltransferase [Acidimicrobiales bacterium]|nr:RsmE family RNA methyltransferase [Acidimicrobiales bacterium]